MPKLLSGIRNWSRKRASVALAALRHWNMEITIAALVAVIVTDLTSVLLYPLESAWLIELGCMAIVIVAFVAGRLHGGIGEIKIRGRQMIPRFLGGGRALFCNFCFTSRGMKLPAEPEAAVQKKHRRLKLVHLLNDRLKWWAVLAYVAIDITATAIVSHFVSIDAAILTSDVFLAGLIYVVLALRSHMRLQGWCPMCHNGGENAERPVVRPLTPQPA